MGQPLRACWAPGQGEVRGRAVVGVVFGRLGAHSLGRLQGGKAVHRGRPAPGDTCGQTCVHTCCEHVQKRVRQPRQRPPQGANLQRGPRTGSEASAGARLAVIQPPANGRAHREGQSHF